MREHLYNSGIKTSLLKLIRKFHAGERLLLFPLWLANGVYLTALAVAHGQRRRARAILLGLADGLRGRFGGQNERVAL